MKNLEMKQSIILDEWDAWMDKVRADKESARLEELARSIETGALPLVGTDSSGRPLRLGGYA